MKKVKEYLAEIFLTLQGASAPDAWHGFQGQLLSHGNDHGIQGPDAGPAKQRNL